MSTVDGLPKLGDLPTIFDRNFILWYFVPSLVASAAAAKCVHGVELTVGQTGSLDTGIITVLCALLVALLLLSFHRGLTRFLEGYGALNPLRLLGFRFLQNFRYQRLLRNRDALIDEAQRYPREQVPAKVEADLATAGQRLAEEFPDREDYLLPTRFGNVVRAFEVYSRVMYGFEATELWPRLLAVVSNDYRSLLNDAEAQTGLWVNVWFLSLLLTIDCLLQWVYWIAPLHCCQFVSSLGNSASGWPIVIVRAIRDLRSLGSLIWGGTSDSGLVLLAAIGGATTAWFSARAAWRSAIEWGVVVKSSFDVFLPDLAGRLGLAMDGDAEERRQQWIKFSQAILYRLPQYLPDRVKISSRAVTG